MFICKASEFKIQFTDVFVCFYYGQSGQLEANVRTEAVWQRKLYTCLL